MIKDLSHVPNKPGVYQFFDSSKIIYIGKAKDLNKRVRSYFTPAIKDRKTEQIKKQAIKVETFATHSETEALILEQQLIKEYKPKFNILLRDDKTYPFIYFLGSHDFPSIHLKRSKQAIDENFFGPYTSSSAVKKSIKEIQKIFKLRNCNDSTFSNRSRPCIEFQMKRCSAPCVKNIKKIDYFEDVESAKSYLSSSDSQTIERLKYDIQKASNELDFEKAANIRDRLKRIELIREEQSVVTVARDIDIFSIHSDNDYLGISIIVVRKGKIRGTKTHLVKKALFESIDSVYQMAIINFYDSQLDIPKKVLCTHLLESKGLISKVLKKKFNANVQITGSPSKSIRPIYNLCKLNAKQIIENHLSKSDKYRFAFNDLKNQIGYKKSIKKIEAYDVSHISGNHAVASCIVFSNEGPCKKEYRTFNIPKELSGNDVGSLEHVIQRRIKYYDNKDTKPDLILIDGGSNQLNFSQSVIHNSEHNDIKVISIVKGINRIRATETILSSNGVIEMDKFSKGYLLLQEIRDESHRFAINAQRKKKNAKNKKSQLDKIEGIGEVLKKRLLLNFKSLKNIKSAKIEDLMTVKGINAKIAQLIKEKL